MRDSPDLDAVKEALSKPELVTPKDIPALLKDALDAIESLEERMENMDWPDSRWGCDCDCA